MTEGAFHPATPVASSEAAPLGITSKGHPRGHGYKVCPECKQRYWAVRHDQVYCPGPCKDTAKNREMVRAREIYRAAYHWVTCGVADRGAFATLMGNVARGWRDADREQGRDAPPLPEGLEEVRTVKAINDKTKLKKGD